MSKELKLMKGNYVQLPYFDNYIAQVKEIKIHGLWVEVKGDLQFVGLSEFVGIPLTPKVLEKCPQFAKYEDLDDEFYYYYKNLYICFNHDEIELGRNGLDGFFCLLYDSKTLQYLHQLQQIVYLLTETELIVNF